MGFDHMRKYKEVRACLCGLCYRRGELRRIAEEQAGAELCQAQVKLGLAKIKISFHLIES